MADRLLLENGDLLLLESGDAFILEEGGPTIGNYFTPKYFGVYSQQYNPDYVGASAVSTRTGDLWFQLHLAKFPATEGTTIYRWSKQPYADDEAFKEGRLISIGKAKRACSDTDGNYQVGKATVTVDDSDNVIRALLEQGTTTEYFLNREAGVYLLSPAGRAAGLTPRTIFRGWISDVQTLKDHVVRIEISDVIGSQFSGFNLDKTIPSVTLSDINPDVIEGLKEKVLPIYAGEHSDAGALDANGEPAEKGLCPAFDVGLVDTSDTDAEATPSYADPPVITSSSVVGSGDQTYTYAATLTTPYGESLPGASVTVSGAPATSVMDISNYVALSGTYVPGAAGTNIVRILGRNGLTTWLDDAFTDPLTGEWWYNDGSHPAPSPTRADVDIEKTYVPPAVTGAGDNDGIWNIMAVCLGYSYDILDVFGSDLAENEEPKRIKFDSSIYGVDILRPQDDGWPYDNPWIEKNGITFTGFLARGPRLRHHLEGNVTFAVDLCGPHDGDGNVINQAFLQLVWVLNEHVAKNGGTGYKTGDYWPLETYANGDPLFATGKFLEKQAITAGWLGTALGYLASIVIAEPITVREFVRRFCQTFGCRLAHDHHGQVFPVLVAAPEDETAGRHLRDRIEIKDIEDPILAHDEVMNRIIYNYHWDPDAQEFKNKGLSSEDANSIAAHTPGGVVGGTDRRGLKQGDERDMYFTNDADTAADVITREIARRQRRPRYLPVMVDYMGLELDIDSPVRVTHHDGMGTSGDVAAPGLVLAHETDCDTDTVTLTVQDLRTIDA